MIDTLKPLTLTKTKTVSNKAGNEILVEQYDLDKLQAAVCIFFFYNEFMENARTTFQEAQSSSTLNQDQQVPLDQIYTAINNLVNRLRNNTFPQPPIEAIMEVLLTKTDYKSISEDKNKA